METITRHGAARLGRKRYFTGQPCLRGHVAERYVSSGRCCQCHLEQQREAYRELQELQRQAREAS